MRQPVQELIERYQNNLYAIAFNICKNQADAEDLMQVEGIGEKRAQSILDYRNQKGRISSMEELLEIDGIGEVLLSRLSEKFYAE